MKSIQSILFIFLTFFIASCNKFLEENPTGSLTPESNVTSPEIARAFANSAYIQLTTLDRGAGGYGGNTAELMEFMTGKADGNPQTEGFRFYNLTYDAQSFQVPDGGCRLVGRDSRGPLRPVRIFRAECPGSHAARARRQSPASVGAPIEMARPPTRFAVWVPAFSIFSVVTIATLIAALISGLILGAGPATAQDTWMLFQKDERARRQPPATSDPSGLREGSTKRWVT